MVQVCRFSHFMVAAEHGLTTAQIEHDDLAKAVG
jgi:hypothetical protein